MQLYGAKAWGSAIVEAMFALAGRPYTFVDVGGFDRPGPARDRLAAYNPLLQVPTLLLDDGTVLTESAAIALWLIADGAPLGPTPGTPDHAKFLRLLVWLVAAVYPTFTYGDYPERWCPEAPAALVASTDAKRRELYLWLESQLVGPFALGPVPTALDAYLAAMLAWRPGPAWFAQHTPKLAAAATRTRALPALAAVRARNGW